MDQSEPCCKVTRVGSRFDLLDFIDDLPQKWQNDPLRELTDYFNGRVLRQQSIGEGDFLEPDEARRLARQFGRGDDHERESARRRIADIGLDPDRLKRRHFITYQTLHNHLTECVGSSHDSQQVSEERVVGTIEKQRAKLAQITEDRVAKAAETDLLDIADVGDVTVRIDVECTECGRFYTPSKLIDDGGCACTRDAEGNPASD